MCLLLLSHPLISLTLCPVTLSQLMFNIEKAHFIVQEMVANGVIVETNKTNILDPLKLLDKEKKAVKNNPK